MPAALALALRLCLFPALAITAVAVWPGIATAGYNPGDGPMCYLDKLYNGITAHPCCITGNRGGTVPR